VRIEDQSQIGAAPRGAMGALFGAALAALETARVSLSLTISLPGSLPVSLQIAPGMATPARSALAFIRIVGHAISFSSGRARGAARRVGDLVESRKSVEGRSASLGCLHEAR